MKIIAYTGDNGIAAIVVPNYAAFEDVEEADVLQYVINNDVPATASDVIVIDQESLPDTREFRAAWVVDGGAVVEDAAKVAAIIQERGE